MADDHESDHGVTPGLAASHISFLIKHSYCIQGNIWSRVKWGERRELRAEGGNGPETFKHVHSVHDKQLSGMTQNFKNV